MQTGVILTKSVRNLCSCGLHILVRERERVNNMYMRTCVHECAIKIEKCNEKNEQGKEIILFSLLQRLLMAFP